MTAFGDRWRMAAIAAGACLSAAGCLSKSAKPSFTKTQLTPVKVGDDVRLTGLESLHGWGEDHDCTFMHCFEVVLKGMGWSIDYDELMGLSGMAFRTQFRVGLWDNSNPDPLVGEECVRPLLAALGCGGESIFPQRDDSEDAARVRQAVGASLDRGVPVLATNLIPPENWGIITGQAEHGRQWWCRTYDEGSSDVLAQGWPSAVVILGASRPRPDRKAVHRASIARAIELHDKAIAADFAQGRKAFDEWVHMLERVTDRDYLHANAWTYVSLIDARRAAAHYLRSIAPEFGKQRPLVEQAAEAYSRQRDVLRSALPAVPWPQDDPGTVPPFETRQRQIAALHEAAGLDDEAIDALRRVK